MIFIDIVFISIFLILFLYRFVDKWIFFCSVGKKLQKISPENQNDINSNLVSQNNNVLSKIFFSRFNLPQKIFFTALEKVPPLGRQLKRDFVPPKM